MFNKRENSSECLCGIKQPQFQKSGHFLPLLFGLLYTISMERKGSIKTFTKNEIKEYILKEAEKTMNEAAIYKRINKLLNDGSLIRVGHGLYSFNTKKRYDYSFEEPLTSEVFTFLKSTFPDNLEYIIYESTILNEFLNHLLAHSTTIIEAPKNYAEDLFWKLQEHGFKEVMLNPTDDERYKYNPSIIIKNMVTKSPIRLKEHKITIEKLLVDIICDNLLNQFYEGDERSFMIEEIFDKYAIKYDSVRNYAKRRRSFDELLKYIPKSERSHLDDK